VGGENRMKGPGIRWKVWEAFKYVALKMEILAEGGNRASA
jgi:hypothetical protein